MTHALQSPEVGVHLAIFVEPYLTAVLDGRKTIESRFGRQRRAPYLTVHAGDILVLKRSGGPVMGLAWAKSVRFYQLSPGVMADLRSEFAARLHALDDEFWAARHGTLFATLVEVEDPTAIADMALGKRDRRGWVTYAGERSPGLDWSA